MQRKDRSPRLQIQSVNSVLDDLRAEVERIWLSEIGPSHVKQPEQIRARIQKICEIAIREHGFVITHKEKQTLIESVAEYILGYGPLSHFLKLPDVNTIFVNNAGEIFVEQNGKITLARVVFENENHLLNIIERMKSQAEQSILLRSTLSLLQMPKGPTVSIVTTPNAVAGTSLTIRLPPRAVDSLAAFGASSPQAAGFLKNCIEVGKRIVICGPGGVGKTTLMMLLAQFIPDSLRVFVIGEETPHLPLNNVEYISERPLGKRQDDKLTILERLEIVRDIPFSRIILPDDKQYSYWSPQVLDALSQTSFMTEICSYSASAAVLHLATKCLHSKRQWNEERALQHFTSSLDLIVHVNRSPKDGYHIVSINTIQLVRGIEFKVVPLFSCQFDENNGQKNLVIRSSQEALAEFLEKATTTHEKS